MTDDDCRGVQDALAALDLEALRIDAKAIVLPLIGRVRELEDARDDIEQSYLKEYRARKDAEEELAHMHRSFHADCGNTSHGVWCGSQWVALRAERDRHLHNYKLVAAKLARVGDLADELQRHTIPGMTDWDHGQDLRDALVDRGDHE